MPMPEDVRPSAGERCLRAAGEVLLAQPRFLAWLAPVAWAFLIFRLSSSDGALEDLPVLPFQGFIWNFAHTLVFGLLALLVVPVAPRRTSAGRRWTALTGVGALWTVLLVTLYGFTDELHQSTVPGRDASLFDVLSDGVGAASVMVIVLYLGRPGRGPGGLRARLLGAAAACAAAAGLATGWDVLRGEGLWPF